MSTLLIINNLSVYTSPYIFCKVSTSLSANNLSVYIIDNGIQNDGKTAKRLEEFNRRDKRRVQYTSRPLPLLIGAAIWTLTFSKSKRR
jgi:hypothetical protein